MKILVTGSEGFVGKNMMAYLGRQPDWVVNGWDWDPNDRPDVTPYDWVVHLGATYTDNVEQSLVQNFEFSQWLFNECQHEGVNMQYASTSSVYGITKDFSEYAPVHPQTAYAWSKYLFDRWVFQQPQYTFVQGFRYFNLYGKWQHLKGDHANSLHKWREQARKQGYIELWEGAEDIYRDWTWVGDVCSLHLDFINTVKGSGLWNVGSGLQHDILSIASEIAEQEGAEIKFIPRPNNINQKIRANIAHLKETVGKRKWLNVYEWLDLEP